MKESLKNMESRNQANNSKKLTNLFEMFPHVECDEVQDVFMQLKENV